MIKIFPFPRKKQPDKEIFTELFKEFQNDLYRMAFTYTKNKDDAMDVVQETAYRAYQKFDTVREIKYIKTWLIKITINCAIDLLRKKQRILPIELTDKDKLIAIENDDIPLTLSLIGLLEVLNGQERTIIFLKYYQGCTFNEIADILNFPASTVKSNHYRALEKLRNSARREDLYGQ